MKKLPVKISWVINVLFVFSLVFCFTDLFLSHYLAQVLFWGMAVVHWVSSIIKEKRKAIKMSTALALIGALLNGLVVMVNYGFMPVFGGYTSGSAEGFRWITGHPNTRLPFLADQRYLLFFSIGDILLILGTLSYIASLIFYHFHKKGGQ